MLVLFVAATVKVVKLPFVLSVAVTVLPLGVAVTPAPTGHRFMAAARLAAKFVVLASVAKVPAVVLPHVFVPFVPAVGAAHEKMVPPFVANTEKVVKVPGVVSVAVTVLVLEVALKPAA